MLTLLMASTLPAASPAQDFSQTQAKPVPSAPLIQQANDALAANDLPAALKILTALNTQTPNDPQVLYDLGFTLEAIADQSPAPSPTPAEAPPTNNVERTTDPTHPQAATAESCYRAAIAADPTFAPPHAALGLLLARTNHPTEAHTELLTAANLPTIEPTLQAHTLRALARLDLNSTPPDPAAASGELLQALKLTQEQPADILLAAEIAEATPDPTAAEQTYRRYLALDPPPPATLQATAALAHILLAQHRPADAESLLTTALAGHPGDPTLTAQLAAAYLASGDESKTAQAAQLLESLHAAHPTDANIARLLARVYLETGHPEQAEPLYAALLSAQSQNGSRPDPTLLDGRAEALMRLHRPGEAENLLKQAIASPAAFPTPGDLATAATDLAFAASEIDDPKMALQALSLRATVLQPSPSTLFLEATANDTLHQTGKAVALYKQFLAAAAGSLPDQELQARQRLAALEARK